ncbi:hypothetical protein D9M71_829080 [compost metagenome]
MNPIFLVDLNAGDGLLAAERGQHGGRITPVICLAYQQRYVQSLQLGSKCHQVTEPEVDFARRVVVRPPLARAYKEHRQGRAGLHGRCQCGVVLNP